MSAPRLTATQTYEAACALLRLVARAQLGQVRGGLAVARAVHARAAWLRTYGDLIRRTEDTLQAAEHGALALEVMP